jgi:hypothetical protein
MRRMTEERQMMLLYENGEAVKVGDTGTQGKKL